MTIKLNPASTNFSRLAEAVAAKAATRGMTDETLRQVMKDVS